MSSKFSSRPVADLSVDFCPSDDVTAQKGIKRLIFKAAGSKANIDITKYLKKAFPHLEVKERKMTWTSLCKGSGDLEMFDGIDFEAESDDYREWGPQMKKRAETIKSIIQKSSSKQPGVYVRRIFPKEFASSAEEHYACLKKILKSEFLLRF